MNFSIVTHNDDTNLKMKMKFFSLIALVALMTNESQQINLNSKWVVLDMEDDGTRDCRCRASYTNIDPSRTNDVNAEEKYNVWRGARG